ncbi:TadE/TadG family type IV pilus assembly protein [Microbacterium sp. H1-D42]|uniref:TadE/TadG family type IV pilus assembly protein n=1 Tax=Microbacterium sp. H1-D42 TaxID=2925844 RepID=UPI001F5362B5|nr:TadE/TadG family type IV pilus assembly protein [Microbacterium sp. H1-D42]UNK71988.1 pilus assembly protein [Microbacterium sp. H1-D42]
MPVRVRSALADERGSSPVEFVLVGALLTALTLAVLQVAFAVYVRNVVHDAAVEGAHYAALADTTPDEGAARTQAVISRAVGPSYAEDVAIGEDGSLGHPSVVVRVRTTLPVLGLIGIPYGLEVEARAPVESFGEE